MHSIKTLPLGGASIAFGCTPTAFERGAAPHPKRAARFKGEPVPL